MNLSRLGEGIEIRMGVKHHPLEWFGNVRSAVVTAGCMAILLALVGCGSNASVTASSVPAPTVTIMASPAAILAGGTSTLTTVATNATSVVVTGTDGSTYTLAPNGGTQAITPSTTTTYTATATGTAGKPAATASTVVSVSAAAIQAPTVTIVASPMSVAAGNPSTLTVVAANATQVTVTGTDGSSYSFQATGGTRSVTPSATTTYTAVAKGQGGSATASAQVAVLVAPTVSIVANPTSISSGGSSTLTITAANATQVVLTGTDGSSYALPPTGGTHTVTPSSTTTYTATATGQGGKSIATVQVTVVPLPTVSMVASPATIAAGSSSTLTITANNATQVIVTGPNGTFTLPQPSGGTMQVSPASTATYTATATGTGGKATAMATVTVTAAPAPTVTISANPTSIPSGNSSALTVVATNATQVTLSGGGTSYTLSPSGGSQTVSPTATTTYTASATGAGGTVSATTVITVVPPGSLLSINHVVFMLQENHTFDNYFGMLNPYRAANGWNVGSDGNTYNVDGIDDKLSKISNESDSPANTSYPLFKFTSSCIDDETSSWLESYGDVNRFDFSTTRAINMDGFVHTAENYAKNCNAAGDVGCAGTFTDFTGQRAMGYYDQGFLNYYYYMASQFAVSDRWFSPVSSKSIDNRIATFTGGTTQGLVFDPGNDDGLSQLQIPTIFQELQNAGVSWKIYYTVSISGCPVGTTCTGSPYPATNFSSLQDSYAYLHQNPSGTACSGTTQPSSVVGDSTNSFCIDVNHIAPLTQYYTDLNSNALPSFAFIEAGYGTNDEHPGSGQEILNGQVEVAKIVNALMSNQQWSDSVFFLSYDEGGGPYDHVPPVPKHSNDYTDPTVGSTPVANIPDISTIAVNPDGFNPCQPANGIATTHCDLKPNDPGTTSTDAAAVNGFAAQLGFRVPNIVISPYTRKHYVSHIPMDHTAIIKFVENRFLQGNPSLTKRDAAQPSLLDFFDFNSDPWATPPTPPTPYTDATPGSSCTPANFGP